MNGFEIYAKPLIGLNCLKPREDVSFVLNLDILKADFALPFVCPLFARMLPDHLHKDGSKSNFVAFCNRLGRRGTDSMHCPSALILSPIWIPLLLSLQLTSQLVGG